MRDKAKKWNTKLKSANMRSEKMASTMTCQVARVLVATATLLVVANSMLLLQAMQEACTALMVASTKK